MLCKLYLLKYGYLNFVREGCKAEKFGEQSCESLLLIGWSFETRSIVVINAHIKEYQNLGCFFFHREFYIRKL